jgi:hypothetical protein
MVNVTLLSSGSFAASSPSDTSFFSGAATASTASDTFQYCDASTDNKFVLETYRPIAPADISGENAKGSCGISGSPASLYHHR